MRTLPPIHLVHYVLSFRVCFSNIQSSSILFYSHTIHSNHWSILCLYNILVCGRRLIQQLKISKHAKCIHNSACGGGASQTKIIRLQVAQLAYMLYTHRTHVSKIVSKYRTVVYVCIFQQNYMSIKE